MAIGNRIILAAFVALVCANVAAADVFEKSNCLPPPGDAYVGGLEIWVFNQVLINLRDPVHKDFVECAKPKTDPGQSWSETFTSRVTGELFFNGNDLGPVDVKNVPVTIDSTVASNANGTEVINSRMTQLDIDLGGGNSIRIDPNDPSLGETTITTLADGFQIGSRFEIFTDISINGGPWTESSGGNGPNGGAEMTLTPEPSFGFLLPLLLAGLAVLRFKKQKPVGVS